MTNLVSNLDINRRPDPILSRVDFLTAENFKRIAIVAIPFLSLHQGTATAISLGSAAGQVYQHLQEENRDVKKVASLVGTATLFFFNPTLGLFLTHGSTLVMDVYAVGQDVLEGKTDELSKRGQEILSTVVYIASAYYGTSIFLTASLLLQAFKEFQEALAEYKEGRYLETAGKIFMGLIRSVRAQAEARQFYREKFGKDMTQSDWDRVMEELKERIQDQKEPETEELHQTFITQRAWELIKSSLSNKSDLEAILDEHNFRREIRGIKLNETFFNWMTLRNVNFINCKINGARFSNGTIENVRFDQCMMKEAEFVETTLKNVWMFGCDLSRASFFQAKMHHCAILSSDLSRAMFNDSGLEGLQIIASKLFGANFLGAEVQDSLIKTCDLTDVLLADAKAKFTYQGCTANRFTRPVIALGWHFTSHSWACDVSEALEDQEALVLKNPFHLPGLESDFLFEEVKAGIEAYEAKRESIPQHLMRNGPWGAETQKIFERARFIGQYADGVIIPGGADVEQEFYLPNVTLIEEDYRKSMMEYALIHEFVTRSKPLMGICRGAQISNTYFPGGTIKDVDDQFGVQRLTFEPTLAGEKFKQLFGPELSGSSAHSQAVDQVGEGLEVALRVGDVIKALLSHDGNVLLTQFHPEHYREGVKIDEALQSGNPEMINKLAYYSLWQMDEKGENILPTFRYTEDRQLEIDRGALEHWIRRLENAMNATVRGFTQLRENNKLIAFFLEKTKKMQEAAPAA